jgi:hypothetical protein
MGWVVLTNHRLLVGIEKYSVASLAGEEIDRESVVGHTISPSCGPPQEAS